MHKCIMESPVSVSGKREKPHGGGQTRVSWQLLKLMGSVGNEARGSVCSGSGMW